jgi:ABC-type sugar transport system, periplasmic component
MLRRFSRKSVAFILVLVLMAMMIAACGQTAQNTTDNKSQGSSAVSTTAATTPEKTDWIHATDISKMPETTIRYWYWQTPERTELGKKQVEEFMKKYPNIKVEGKIGPKETVNEMLLPYIKSRSNSNIIQSVAAEDLWYVDHNLLYPLDNFPDFKDQLARLNDKENYTWQDGHTYSLSWYSEPFVVYYNKKLVEEAGLDPNNLPKTYDEYLTWAKALTKKDASGKVVQWALAPWMGEEWWRWQFTTGALYFAATGSNQLTNKEGTKAIFNNELGMAPFKLYDTMFKEGYAAKTNAKVEPFITGQAATCIMGTYLMPEIKRSASFEYLVGPIPKPANAPSDGISTYGFVRDLGIVDEGGLPEGDERDRVRRASWEFLKFLLSEEQAAADYTVSGSIPTLKDVDTNPVFTKITETYGEPMKQAIGIAKGGAIWQTNTIKETEIQLPLTKAFLNIALGKMTAEQAVAQAEKDVNDILAKSK